MKLQIDKKFRDGYLLTIRINHASLCSSSHLFYKSLNKSYYSQALGTRNVKLNMVLGTWNVKLNMASPLPLRNSWSGKENREMITTIYHWKCYRGSMNRVVKRSKVSLWIVSFPRTCKWEYTTVFSCIHLPWEPFFQWDSTVMNYVVFSPHNQTQHKKLGTVPTLGYWDCTLWVNPQRDLSTINVTALPQSLA